MPPMYLHPRKWLVISLIAAFAFALLAFLYATGSPVNRIDVWLGIILYDLEDQHITWLNSSMKVVTFFGGNGSLIVATCVALYLVRRRSWAELVLWLVAVGGVILVNRLLKDSFETLRPVVGYTNQFEESTGFPSGHAMVAVVTYGLLAYLAAARATTRSVYAVSLLVAGALIMAISFSRLFFSLHYLSDVFGGLAAGVAWLGMCLWLYERGVASRIWRLVTFRCQCRSGVRANRLMLLCCETRAGCLHPARVRGCYTVAGRGSGVSSSASRSRTRMPLHVESVVLMTMTSGMSNRSACGQATTSLSRLAPAYRHRSRARSPSR